MILMKKLKQMLELVFLGLSSKYIMDYFKKGAVTVPKLPIPQSEITKSELQVLCSYIPVGVYQYIFYTGCKRMKNEIFSLCF